MNWFFLDSLMGGLIFTVLTVGGWFLVDLARYVFGGGK